MPDDAPAASDRAPHLAVGGEPCALGDCPPGLFLFDGCLGFKDEYDHSPYCADSGEYFWGGTDTPAARDDLIVTPIAVVDGCRAAGAATPPADAPDYCRERDAAYERYMGKRPRDPDGRDEDVWVTSRNAFRAGWDARGALAAGAGAATPALTPAELHEFSAISAILRRHGHVGSSQRIIAIRDRLLIAAPAATAAGGVAAAPSPAATPSQPKPTK
jgi:hypothetical protein